ncbi:uncharacterized protein PV07_05720 [Cladophialophora immunda]|uniref:DUF6594 domain-containing protein n=1 Tax=Cladophialophora immunda TaxID=569365 RepID=A0A0D2CIG8_9EURO|nr:uncharacterized protein PV07_05720 [Cladophialophora immunda]KIW29935.1 hypothetical protein PV07_05720 [Cladophialophora immunda]
MDIETGLSEERAHRTRSRLLASRSWTSCARWLPAAGRRIPDKTRKIEDYPRGYPQFSALVAASDGFYICRRFSHIRARLLLLKQDRLSQLEKQLEQVDDEEPSPLFLGKSRLDANEQRRTVLAELETALADYDSFVERTSRFLQLKPASPGDVTSLKNWVDGTASLAREETEYLNRPRDLVNLASLGDSAMAKLEAWVETKMIRFYPGFRKLPLHEISRDPNVYIYSGSLVTHVSKAVLLFLVVALLLTPVLLCSAVESMALRIAFTVVANILTLSILTNLANSRTFELFVAGSTYCTLLVVFLSGSGPKQN